jgi:hypothetical protein
MKKVHMKKQDDKGKEEVKSTRLRIRDESLVLSCISCVEVSTRIYRKKWQEMKGIPPQEPTSFISRMTFLPSFLLTDSFFPDSSRDLLSQQNCCTS